MTIIGGIAMRHFSILALVGAALLSSQAGAQSRGRNGDGDCVPACSRSGGRPCPPCMPTVGPDNPDFERQVAEARLANDAFERAVREDARADRDYRNSEMRDKDRNVIRQNDRILNHLERVGAISKEF